MASFRRNSSWRHSGAADSRGAESCEGDGDSSIGSSRWNEHENLETGFAASPLGIALPAGWLSHDIGADPCRFTGNRTDRTFALTELNGDGIPDLVATADCVRDASMGSCHGTVHPLQYGE